MKLVVCSCSHFDLNLGTYDAHADIVEAMHRVVDATHAADLFIHCGDVFDTNRPTPRAYAAVIELLNGVGCDSVLLCGNHDSDALEPLKKVDFPRKVRVVDFPCALAIGDKHFVFVPYVTEAMARRRGSDIAAQEWIDRVFERARYAHEHDIEGKWRADAVFGHLSVQGVVTSTGWMMRGQDLALPLKVAKNLPCPVIVGHVHKPQKVEPNIWVVGSVVPTDMGEKDDEKSYLRMEV